MLVIAQLKYYADNFNFFLRTTAGKTLVILLMVLVNTIGVTLFFRMVFTEKIAEYAPNVAGWLPYGIGFVFALVISAGSYVATVNSYQKLGKTLFFLSAVLSLATYGMMLVPNSLPVFGFNPETIRYAFNIIAIMVIAFTPDYIAKQISNKITEEYKNDNYMKALDKQLESLQTKKIEADINKIANSYSTTSEEADRNVQQLLRDAGIRVRQTN